MALVHFLGKSRVMLNHSMKNLVLGAALALTVGGVWAQTATTPANNIGVTPQNAKEATQKAVPQANTGTVVRTEPSAVTRAEEAAKDVGNAAGSTASTSANENSTLVSGNTNRNTRALRADRN